MGKRSILWQHEEEISALADHGWHAAAILRHFGFAINQGNYETLGKVCAKFGIIIPSYDSDKRNNTGRKRKYDLNELLIENSDYTNGSRLKKRLLKEGLLEDKCYGVGCPNPFPMWAGKELVLQLDHIDGNRRNNKVNNLRLLCPNCHSQTDTYTARKLKVVSLCACGKEKKKKSTRCLACHKIYIKRNVEENKSKKAEKRSRERVRVPRKTWIQWPTVDVVEKRAKDIGFLATGKELGVSDNAVRKFLRKHGINVKFKGQ